MSRYAFSPENAGIYLSARLDHQNYWSQLLPMVQGFEMVIDRSQVNKPEFHEQLQTIQKTHPVAFHCLDLSVGTNPSIRADQNTYLESLQKIIAKHSVELFSDHLSFSQSQAAEVPNFIPLTFDDQSLEVTAHNITTLKKNLKVPYLAFENICYYFSWQSGSESQFIAKLLEKTDSHLLLDLNNLYVNSVNHQFDPYEWLKEIPAERIAAIHVAGHERQDNILLDSHNQPVCSEVLDLLSYSLQNTPASKVILEWDHQFSESSVQDQLQVLQSVWEKSRGTL